MNNFTVKQLSCMRRSIRAELKYHHGILLLTGYYSVRPRNKSTFYLHLVLRVSVNNVGEND